ncbi:MAG: sugar phosphate isomerase/epimerase [Bacteroidetes bacterium]|nr:sugar phosphate isomerase/epimerase [Bacteroidota bacterium]
MKSINKYSRRKFLETTGISSMSVFLGSSILLSGCGSKEKAIKQVAVPVEPEVIHKISCQLYTFRNQLSEDIPGTLQKVADTGLKYVETFDFSEELSADEGTSPSNPAAMAKMLKDVGLSVSSMHSEIPVGDEGEKALRMAEAYGCKKVIWHGWPEDKRYQSLDGIKELAGIYNEANQFLKANGLEFGLHNHWWEMRLDESGGYPLQTLLEYTDNDIFLEIDTYWVKTAQRDPAEIIEKFGKRVQFMHMKDGPAPWMEDLAAQPHEPMVALGKGVQDFNAITKACGDHPKWMVIELDECATDIFEAVKESVDYLTSNNMAKA